MKNKGKAIAWVILYIGIALALQFIMGIILVLVVYGIALSEGIFGDADAMMWLFENGIGISYDPNSLSTAIDGSVAMTITALCDLVMLVGFGLWYYFRENKYPFRVNYRKAFTPSNVLATLGIAFFGQFAVSLILVAVNYLFPSIFQQYEELSKSFDLNTITPVAMIFIVCILGPLAEEMLFRGMIYAKLRRAFSVWPAAIISGILFGLFHANWVQGIYASLFGVVLAYIYEKTQTIWGSCLLHVVFNSLSYPLEYIEGSLPVTESFLLEIGMLGFEVISLIVVILLMRHFRTRRAV